MKLKIKSLLIAGTVASMLFPTTASACPDYKPNTIYSTACLNVRFEPSLEAGIFCVYPPNSEMIRVSEGSEWDTVMIDDDFYYVSNDYISEEKQKIYLGDYKITAYCSCEKCCGKWSKYGLTSSGNKPTAGWTVSCNSIDEGTEIIIDGTRYIVEDTGNIPDNVIDIYMDSHAEAKEFGVKYESVYLAD